MVLGNSVAAGSAEYQEVLSPDLATDGRLTREQKRSISAAMTAKLRANVKSVPTTSTDDSDRESSRARLRRAWVHPRRLHREQRGSRRCRLDSERVPRASFAASSFLHRTRVHRRIAEAPEQQLLERVPPSFDRHRLHSSLLEQLADEPIWIIGVGVDPEMPL